jgi:hypothetical protein
MARSQQRVGDNSHRIRRCQPMKGRDTRGLPIGGQSRDGQDQLKSEAVRPSIMRNLGNRGRGTKITGG